MSQSSLENSTAEKWKDRHELPVLKKLGMQVDITRLQKELLSYSQGKIWDGLGSDYATLCETHTRLPAMFFRSDELEGISHVCDLDWQKISYQQLSLTEFNPDYSLDKRTEQSGSAWDRRIAKGKPDADERWFGKLKQDVPEYFAEILNSVRGSHRARFALLAAQSNVKPHIDYDTLYGIRLHIALATNEHCFNGGWTKDGEEVREHIPADGSVWFVNPGVKHYALNGGATPRIHLIISVDSQEPLAE